MGRKANQTVGLITEIVTLGAVHVDSSTKLVLANAVYFNGVWIEMFNQSNTKDYDFHLIDGSKVQVPLLTTKEKQLSVCILSGFKLVSLIMVDGSLNGGPRLCFVNGVWVEQTISLKSSFKEATDFVYNALCKQVDFKNKANEVAEEVNSWAKNHTNGLIQDILPAGFVDDATRLIFANAIYFKGSWNEKFDPSKTKDHDFHLIDGSKVQVPFMTTKEKQLVRSYDGFKVLGLPYLHGEDKRRFTMYIFLPDAEDGLLSLVQKMGSESDFLDRHIPTRKVSVRQLLIPKFKISFGFEASDMLKELGLILPFSDEESNLTEMVDLFDGESLYVSSILHKAFVEVNEEGTEAAAVTVAAIRYKTSNIDVKVDFVADHPFLFVIREDTSGVVLFMGQLNDPRVA